MQRYKLIISEYRRGDSGLFYHYVSITMVIIANSFCMNYTKSSCRASSIPSMGVTAPEPECSCQGGEIAGIGSGTVSGTTYSWCETSGGLPTGVPPEATIPPVTSDPAPASQCVQISTTAREHALTCSSSISKSDLATALPEGMFTCLSDLDECYCQGHGQPRVCQPVDQKTKGKKRHVLGGAPEPTAAPLPRR